MEARGIRYIHHPSRTDEFRLWAVGDIHLGNRAVSKHRLQEDIDTIAADPRSFWVGLGDYAEYISAKDRKRFDPRCLDPDIIKLCDLGNLGVALASQVRDMFKPIAHKCLGLAKGNHEFRYEQEQEQEGLHGWLCTELGVPNLEYSSLFGLVFVRDPRAKTPRIGTVAPKGGDCNRLTIYVHHGAGAANTKAGKTSRTEKAGHITLADITFIGHSHDTIPVALPTLDLDKTGSKIIYRKRMALMTGSYLRTYAEGQTGYGERAMYQPACLGAVWVAYKPETGEMRSEVRA